MIDCIVIIISIASIVEIIRKTIKDFVDADKNEDNDKDNYE